MRLLARTSLPILACAAFLAVPAYAYAALININTADLVTLEALPHVGSTIAQRIIDYRTQNGAFTSVTQLQSISGIGSGSNYADIAPLVTVGDAPSVSPPASQDAATTTASTTASSNGASTYVPPPSTLSLTLSGPEAVLLEVPTAFSATVKGKNGAADIAAIVSWSFGDGSSASGRTVEKTYRHPGTYLVVARASDGDATSQADSTVTATLATLTIPAVSAEGITIENDGASRLDLSHWRLIAGGGTFRLPEGTMLLPQSSVLFPYAITDLPIALDAALYYPDGMLAVRYAPLAPSVIETNAQPAAALAGSGEVVQLVEAVRTSPSPVPHVTQAIAAPSAAVSAALGAAVPAASSTEDAGASPSPASAPGLLHSRWTLGALGMLAVIGGAIMIL